MDESLTVRIILTFILLVMIYVVISSRKDDSYLLNWWSVLTEPFPLEKKQRRIVSFIFIVLALSFLIYLWVSYFI